MKKLSMIGAALAMTAGATIAAAPANAQYYGGGNGYAQGARGYYGDRGYDRRVYRNRGYDNRAYANGYYGNNRAYYGRNSYSYRCRNDGTTGTVLGAIVGGLLGDAAVGRHGDGTAGAIVGAGVGALAGRAIDRSDSRC